MQFVDANHGWAHVAGGELLRTTDGGANWEVLAPLLPCNHFFFVDAGQGWAVCDRIWHTTDGGLTWQPQKDLSPSDQANAMHFVDATHGWVVGTRVTNGDSPASGTGLVMSTTDGGATWRTATVNGVDGLEGVYFVDEDEGWVVGAAGAILHSSDGGNTWTPQASGTVEDLKSVQFVNAREGWALGYGIILRTTDGGQTWQARTSGAHGLAAVQAENTGCAWAVGSEGAILRTVDGGNAWTRQPSGVTAGLRALHFPTPALGWAVGGDGVILHTTDSGLTWSRQTSGITTTLNAVHFPALAVGWAVGEEGVILHTTNSGASWRPQESGVTQALKAVAFTDARRGWAVGHDRQQWELEGGVVLHTTDGGQTWEESETLARWDVGFSDAMHGWQVESFFVGWDATYWSTVFGTSDGGQTWQPLSSEPPVNLGTFSRRLTNADFFDALHGWAAGEGILGTADGGQTWGLGLIMTGGEVTSLDLLDQTTGWAVTGDGAILKQTQALLPLTTSARVVAGDDDTSVREDTGENLADWDKLRLGRSAYAYTNGLRFQDLDLPPGAAITQATLSLHYADWLRGLPVPLTIYAENVDSSVSFGSANPLANLRPRTTAAIPWTITSTPVGWLDSPDLATLVQEVIDRPGWQKGNDLSLLIRSAAVDTGSHYLDVAAWDLNPARRQSSR